LPIRNQSNEKQSTISIPGSGRFTFTALSNVLTQITDISGILPAKKIFKFELKPLHFDNLQKKGLFVKRHTVEATGEALISIDKAEYERTYNYWKIIDQIDQLNEKGSVDFATPAEEPINTAAQGGCVTCGNELLPDANFCMNCGSKVAKAA
jgi:hypothetical protein